MTKTRREELEKIIADAQAELAALPEKPKTVWDLTHGYACYRINADGGVACYLFDRSEERCRDQGNVFLTHKEAKDEVRRNAIHTQLKRLADGYKFTGGKENLSLEWNYAKNKILYNVSSWYKTARTVYFPSEQALKAVVKEIGEDKIEFYLKG